MYATFIRTKEANSADTISARTARSSPCLQVGSVRVAVSPKQKPILP